MFLVEAPFVLNVLYFGFYEEKIFKILYAYISIYKNIIYAIIFCLKFFTLFRRIEAKSHEVHLIPFKNNNTQQLLTYS